MLHAARGKRLFCKESVPRGAPKPEDACTAVLCYLGSGAPLLVAIGQAYS